MSCVCHAFASVYCCHVVTCWERADLMALVCDVKLCFVPFPCGILGQVRYLIVSFPDLCRHSHLDIFTGQICARVASVVKTQRELSPHGGFLACVKLESPFNKSAEKVLIYKKDSLIYYTQWSHRVWNTSRSS